MDTQYLALDGSVVSVRSEAAIRPGPVTASGWAITPSLMRAHPYTIYPAGHSRVIEGALRQNFPDIEVSGEEELSLKDGTLRLGQVSVPREGGQQRITVGAWEGRHGCMTTSLPEGRQRQLVEAFDTLQFTDGRGGLVVDSPVVTRPRPPELIQEIVGLGVMTVRPAVATELERVPRGEGRRTRHGEVFRIRAESRALLFLGAGAVVRIQPGDDIDDGVMAEAVDGLEVEWSPRSAPRAKR